MFEMLSVGRKVAPPPAKFLMLKLAPQTTKTPLNIGSTGTAVTLKYDDGTTQVIPASTSAKVARVPINTTFVELSTSVPTVEITNLTITSPYVLEVLEWSGFNFTGISFHGCTNLVKVPDYLPKSVTSLLVLFKDCVNFNDPNITKWDVSRVTVMENTFRNCSVFDQDISTWDMGNVTDADSMFHGASVFNQDIGNWDTKSLISADYVFREAKKFNQNINDWDMRLVSGTAYMFYEANAFNQPLDKWTFTKLNTIRYMFYNAYNFNQPIGNWNVAGVSNFEGAFSGCLSFNQNLNTWNVIKASNMLYMFDGCLVYNQPMDSWNTTKCLYMGHIFRNCLAFNQNISMWVVSQVTATYRVNFDLGAINWSASYKPKFK